MDSKKLARFCREAADDKKAEDISVLDVRKVSTVTDFFVIASGTSDPHVRAITNAIQDTLREKHDLSALSVDGDSTGGWVVLDYFDVIVHVMRKDTRDRYDLEGLWRDAEPVQK